MRYIFISLCSLIIFLPSLSQAVSNKGLICRDIDYPADLKKKGNYFLTKGFWFKDKKVYYSYVLKEELNINIYKNRHVKSYEETLDTLSFETFGSINEINRNSLTYRYTNWSTGKWISWGRCWIVNSESEIDNELKSIKINAVSYLSEELKKKKF